jgi:hypothetical protein
MSGKILSMFFPQAARRLRKKSGAEPQGLKLRFTNQ